MAHIEILNFHNRHNIWPLYFNTIVIGQMDRGEIFLKKLWRLVSGGFANNFGFMKWGDNVNWPP